jgi:HEAT repeat protein
MRFFAAVLLAVLLSGCSNAQPTRPVGHWVGALQDPDPRLRKQAAFNLGNIGPADPTVFPALLGALRDRDAKVRCEAIVALLKFGSDAKEAIPALTTVQQQDRDARVRSYAAKALEKLQGNEGRVSRGHS